MTCHGYSAHIYGPWTRWRYIRWVFAENYSSDDFLIAMADGAGDHSQHREILHLEPMNISRTVLRHQHVAAQWRLHECSINRRFQTFNPMPTNSSRDHLLMSCCLSTDSHDDKSDTMSAADNPRRGDLRRKNRRSSAGTFKSHIRGFGHR